MIAGLLPEIRSVVGYELETVDPFRASGLATGSHTVKVEPAPGVLSTPIEPSRRSQNRRVMARPRPVPPPI